MFMLPFQKTVANDDSLKRTAMMQEAAEPRNEEPPQPRVERGRRDDGEDRGFLALEDVLIQAVVVDHAEYNAMVATLKAIELGEGRSLDGVVRNMLNFATQYRHLSFGNLPRGIQEHLVETNSDTLFEFDTLVLFKIQDDVTGIQVSTVETMIHGSSISEILPNVRTLDFYSKQGTMLALYEDPTFVDNIVSFLSSFAKLKRAAFSDSNRALLCLLLQLPKTENGTFGGDDISQRRLPMDRLVNVLCDAYESGDLASSVKISEIFCFCPRHPAIVECALCHRVLKTFPVDHLLLFKKFQEEGEGKSCVSFDFHTVSTSLSRVRDPILQPNAMKTFVARPGGREVLLEIFNRMQEEM